MRRALLAFPLSALVLVTAGCPHTQPRFNYASEADPRKTEFIIGPSDTLKVTIWKNPDLSGDTTVRPDGVITLPLLGDFHAAGKTAAELRAEIRTRLATFVKDDSALVTVAITGINSYRVTVSGNVEHPGTYAVNHYINVAEALMLAGGVNKFGTPEDGVLIRVGADGATRRIPVDCAAILSGARQEQNLTILTGDTIYVP
ncbi:MAG TPA: polysaccharide biosynthesis/export family protein [Polyangia bacterium]|nr:polysaccharide biosynthesis/export family protein [Polyangia bacterium]